MDHNKDEFVEILADEIWWLPHWKGNNMKLE